jgi:hypothetical protein
VFDEPSQNSQEEEDMEDPRNEEDNVKIHQLYKPSQDLKTIATGLVLVWSYLFHKDYKHAEDYTVVLIEQATRFFAEVTIISILSKQIPSLFFIVGCNI